MRRTALVLAGVLLFGTAVAARVRGVSLAEGLPLMVVGSSFVGAGVIASTRRPANRSGQLLSLTGLGWLLSVALTTVGNDLVFTAGLALFPFGLAPLAHLAVAFPDGNLGSRAERRLVAAIYGVALACLPVAGAATCQDCGPHTVGLDIRRGLGKLWYSALLVAVIGITAGVLVVLARRWRNASPAARRILLPVVPGACFFAAVYIGALLAELGVPTGLGPRWALVGLALVGASPLVFLGGLLRSRLARGGVSRLVVDLGASSRPPGLRDALASALGDPTLELVYWSAESDSYLQPGGAPAVLPTNGSGRSVAVIQRGGRQIGALVYDAALLDDPALVDAVAAAAGLAIENERLHAEVVDRLEEVRTSRVRIVVAGDSARRKVERDLHDGAQQRLVALTMAVGRARAGLGPAPDPKVDELLRQAGNEASLALRELRELAQGLHPAVLNERGLAAALESLAERSTVPVAIAVTAPDRPPPAVEAVAYFMVSEALANVAKHAQATAVDVRITERDHQLHVEVSDDGVGGAAARPGSGLEGLADRVAALDGRMEIVSPCAGGTRVTVVLPCG